MRNYVHLLLCFGVFGMSALATRAEELTIPEVELAALAARAEIKSGYIEMEVVTSFFGARKRPDRKTSRVIWFDGPKVRCDDYEGTPAERDVSIVDHAVNLHISSNGFKSGATRNTITMSPLDKVRGFKGCAAVNPRGIGLVPAGYRNLVRTPMDALIGSKIRNQVQVTPDTLEGIHCVRAA